MGRSQSLDTRTAQFVRAHLGRSAFAPFTSTDTRAWHAFLDLLELYGSNPGDKAIAAMRSVVLLAQPKEPVLLPFVQAIPAVLDWGYVEKIWPRVCHGVSALPPDALRYAALERNGPTVRRWGYQVYAGVQQHAH